MLHFGKRLFGRALVALVGYAIMLAAPLAAMAQTPGKTATASSTMPTILPVVATTASTATCPALLQYKFNRLQDEAPQNLCQYAGKVALIVNTASYCGYTSQYQGLESLFSKYASRGLVVLGFPSNDFGKQEPGTGKEIADFCFNTYGVKFPMFSKSVVSGSSPNPLYQSLAKATGSKPQWNFHKYLLDRNGKIAATFGSDVSPESPQVVGAIEKALNQKL